MSNPFENRIGDEELTDRERLISYYSFARGILEVMHVPANVNELSEAFALYATNGQDGDASRIWDDFLDTEIATDLLAEIGVY